MTPRFSMTPEGFAEAVAYLKKVGHLDDLQKEQSTDGYTLIHLANIWFERLGDA